MLANGMRLQQRPESINVDCVYLKSAIGQWNAASVKASKHGGGMSAYSKWCRPMTCNISQCLSDFVMLCAHRLGDVSHWLSILARRHRLWTTRISKATSATSMQQKPRYACITYGVSTSNRWYFSWLSRISQVIYINGRQHQRSLYTSIVAWSHWFYDISVGPYAST